MMEFFFSWVVWNKFWILFWMVQPDFTSLQRFADLYMHHHSKPLFSPQNFTNFYLLNCLRYGAQICFWVKFYEYFNWDTHTKVKCNWLCKMFPKIKNWIYVWIFKKKIFKKFVICGIEHLNLVISGYACTTWNVSWQACGCSVQIIFVWIVVL